MSESLSRRGHVAPTKIDDAPIIAEGGQTLAQMDVLGMVKAASMLAPRDIESVKARVLEEAQYLGAAVGYSWPVKGKTGGIVSGMTIKGAMMLLRNYGKCTVVPRLVSEDSRQWVLEAVVIDFETMVPMSRLFVQRKGQDTGMDDRDRAQDIVFQIGQSKAIRNAILNALPAWLVEGALKAAKAGAKAKIPTDPKAIAKAVAGQVEWLVKRGVSQERVEAVYQKAVADFDADDLVDLAEKVNAMHAGEESAETLFPRDSAEADPKKAADDLFQGETK